VLLCLFVGDGGGGEGGGAKVPEGLQGDEESKDAKVKFERRRQRESRREKSGKKRPSRAVEAGSYGRRKCVSRS